MNKDQAGWLKKEVEMPEAAESIVLSRRGVEGSHTLDVYLETGGYEGLRKALAMNPEEIVAQVVESNILGRGGAKTDGEEKEQKNHRPDKTKR